MGIADTAPITGEHPLVVTSRAPSRSDEMTLPLAAGPDVPAIGVVTDAHVVDFDSFYRDCRRSVGRALALTLRDVDLATEVVDEALARAYQRWDRVGRLENPSGWVYRVALNHARSRIRRITRRQPAPSGDGFVEFSVVDPAIGAAIGALSVEHRAVVVCRLLLGWSELQTATSLGIRPGTVKSRLHRATRLLERRLHHLRPEES